MPIIAECGQECKPKIRFPERNRHNSRFFHQAPGPVRQNRAGIAAQGWHDRLKIFKKPGGPGIIVPRESRVDLVITCTFKDRWVASSTLYRFQLPAANGSREACEPRADPASLITKCGLKKDLSRTPQGAPSKTALHSVRRSRTPLRFRRSPARRGENPGRSGSLFLCRLFFVEKRLHKQIVDRFQFLV